MWTIDRLMIDRALHKTLHTLQTAVYLLAFQGYHTGGGPWWKVAALSWTSSRLCSACNVTECRRWFTQGPLSALNMAVCAKHLTIEFYAVVVLLTFILIIITVLSPCHSFIPGLKPSFSADPSHCRLFFLLQDWYHGFLGLKPIILALFQPSYGAYGLF